MWFLNTVITPCWKFESAYFEQRLANFFAASGHQLRRSSNIFPPAAIVNGRNSEQLWCLPRSSNFFSISRKVEIKDRWRILSKVFKKLYLEQEDKKYNSSKKFAIIQTSFAFQVRKTRSIIKRQSLATETVWAGILKEVQWVLISKLRVGGPIRFICLLVCLFSVCLLTWLDLHLIHGLPIKL